MNAKAVTLGLIVGTRDIFNAEHARTARIELLAKMKKLGIDYRILPEDGTSTGGSVQTLEDARKCAELFGRSRDQICGVLVVLPNFSDELGIVNTLSMAKLNVPVLVQACDDDNDKVDLKGRRDAFCGKISVCNNLYQYGIPFTDTTYHTYPIDSELFDKDVKNFVAICRVVRGLRGARIGAIGARPGAFQTMRASEKLLQASGITVLPVDLSEILFSANRLDAEQAEVRAKMEEIRAYGSIPKSIAGEKVVRQAKLFYVIEQWIQQNDIDAAGVQCWTSIQDNYGCAACLSMSMLGEKLTPCACEVDITGVTSMYALRLATETPSALLDWNNNYGTDRNMVVGTHCSNYPKGFIGGPVEISNLGVLSTTLGEDNCFGGIKGKVAPGPMTYFRVSTDDPKGKIKAYLGGGVITDDPYGMDGGIAVCRIPRLQDLMKFICRNGFEHHVAMGRGDVESVLEEAIGKYMGWDLYTHR
jgi:L-fucose isomerase-like protein